MADIGELARALQRAHSAGDTAAARRFAGEIKRLRAESTVRHPEFDPANVPGGVSGYNAETGLVNKPMSKADSLALGGLDTMTMGFGDEIGASISSMVSGRSYDNELGRMRELATEGQAQNPKTYLMGQVGGGVTLGAALGNPSIMPGATSLGGQVVGGGLTGLGFGGLYGFGSGEGGFQNRMIRAAKDGALGAATGMAIPVVARGASSLYEGVRNWIRGNQIAKGAGTTPDALRMLGDVMDADGSLGPQGQANMARAGSEAMLADAGPNARRVLDTAIQRGGPGAVTAREAIDDRVARGVSDLTGALDNTLGAPQGVTATRTAIRTNSAGARSSAYDDAYRMAIDYADPRGQAIEKMVKGRVPGRIISEANELMRLGGDESSQILAKIADDGSVVFETLPDVRQIDYITKALNQAAESGDGAGALGGQTAKGRAYQNLAREIRDNLKELVPEYGTALETAADPIRRSQAVQLGSRILSPSMTRDQVEEAVRGMTGPEKSALAQGVRSQIDDAMANVTRTIQDGNVDAREAVKAIRDLSSRASREKLAMAIGETEADKLLSEVDRIATSFDLRASVAQNSATYARQATDQRVKDITGAGGVMDAALQGKPLNAIQRVTQAVTGRTPQAMKVKEDAVYSELARLLTDRRDPFGAAQATQLLGVTDKTTRANAERIRRALSGPRLSYPLSVMAGNAIGLDQ